MDNISDQIDEFGNLWINDFPIRSDMSASEFRNRFSNYSTIAVNCMSDQIYAAGSSITSLEAGFLKRGLNPKDYQLEPGPLSNFVEPLLAR